MKKHFITAVCLFLVLACMTCTALAQPLLKGYGDNGNSYQYVHFGSYYQDINGEKRPLLWRVLSAEGDQALLLSEYVLGSRRVHPDDKEYVAFKGQWDQTDMYQYLNNTFYREAFSAKEQALVMEEEGLGLVFLPSSEDLNNKAYGFSSNKSRQGYGTPFAIETGLFKYSKGSSPYWTRSQSTTQISGTRCTKSAGNIGYIRCVVEDLGWRPAFYLNIENLVVSKGGGTLESPFEFTLP